MATAAQIRQRSRPVDDEQITRDVRVHLDTHFNDLDVIMGHAQAGPSDLKRVDSRQRGAAKKQRTLKQEIAFWEEKEASAATELEETGKTLPGVLQSAQERLGKLLGAAQELSLERYKLADKLSTLISELDSSRPLPGDEDARERKQTILEQMELMQQEQSRLEVGLVWVTVLEKVLDFSEKTLSPSAHSPSPLAALPHYTALHEYVGHVQRNSPPDTALLRLIIDVREQTWRGLKDLLSQILLKALEPLKWPLHVEYTSVPVQQRREFERAFQDLLYLQAEGEGLGIGAGGSKWYDGVGLYPLQAIVQPIALRFRYHFQGSRDTNRVDKPEWAFTNILDQIYEHQGFLTEVLRPLTIRAGYEAIDVKSEFIMLLFPILLSLLRSRIPHLLDHPALLAHTIYQTVVFDDAVRENGFDIDAVSINEGAAAQTWEGLSGVLLRQEGWFQQWLAGEKKFADGQLHDIISSAEAWTISEEAVAVEDSETDSRPTNSARQVKALIEQITDRYSPLPSLTHRLPFVTTIQLPVLTAYLSRISGSLDAFETLSSSFVRAVPGALAGNTRSGVHIDQTKLTGGRAGLERLIKANLSAAWVHGALRQWADDTLLVEMSGELASSPELRSSVQADISLPASLRSGENPSVSVFDVMLDRYRALIDRTQEMMVKHISSEVEIALKQHLTRRWDRTDGSDPEPDPSLVHALATLSTHLTALAELVSPLTTSKIYRRVVSHLSNHISQRAIYAGWSKFSYLGGKDFSSEMTDWVNTSETALSNHVVGGKAGVEAPWRSLSDIARMLALPKEEDGDRPTFAQAMAAGWADGEESLKLFCERLGTRRLSRSELQGILRRRVDCWR